ncbi:MAG TPA: hypothetical protein DCM68_03640, partial [Verrucomicrobia bacterium]|nr:hypothetical protein [Verrucomicrobiota bacterium]
YRLKEVPEGQEAAAMTRAEAQDWMRSKVNALLRESARCMVPGGQSKKFDDGALRSAVSLAWQKETRFPFTLSLALRPAFRHMHLHLFKVNARETYVTAVPPKPVDLAAVPAIVKEIVAFLEAHPGHTRQQVLEGLRPGADPESSDAAELLLHLNNLVANGGVIEFFNATLVLPRGVSRAEAKKEGGPAAETPVPEEEPAMSVPEGTLPESPPPESAEEETPAEAEQRPDALPPAEPVPAESTPAVAPVEEDARPE